MEVQQKKGNAPCSLVNGSGLVPLFQNSRSEVTHFSHSLLLPALEWHQAARSSAARLTVKGGKHGARAVSPSVVVGAAVTRAPAGGSSWRTGAWNTSFAVSLNAGVKGLANIYIFVKRLFKSIKTQNGHHGNSCVYAITAPVAMGKRTAAGQPLIFFKADIFRTYSTITFSFLYVITRTILNLPIPYIFLD